MENKEEISSRIYHIAMRSNSNKRKIRIGKINITMPIMAFSSKIQQTSKISITLIRILCLNPHRLPKEFKAPKVTYSTRIQLSRNILQISQSRLTQPLLFMLRALRSVPSAAAIVLSLTIKSTQSFKRRILAVFIAIAKMMLCLINQFKLSNQAIILA